MYKKRFQWGVRICALVILHTSQSQAQWADSQQSQRPCHIVTLRLCATLPLCQACHTASASEQQHKTSHSRLPVPQSRPILVEMPPPIRWEKVETVSLIVTNQQCITFPPLRKILIQLDLVSLEGRLATSPAECRPPINLLARKIFIFILNLGV